MRENYLSCLGLRALALVLLGIFGCSPAIGDECVSSVDCSQAGDRLCDVTQLGGYCTIFNCEPDGCPDDSECVVFGTQVSPRPECANEHGLSRVHRSFCMAACQSRNDCRPGYVCADVGRPDNPWSAIVAGRGEGRVCMEPLIADPVPSDRPTDVCQVSRSRMSITYDDAEGGAGSAED